MPGGPAAVHSDGQRGTHHTRSDQTSVQNSVVSHSSLNVYSHDGQTDFPVPPRECNSCGTFDVDKFTLYEHVQTVLGGVCPVRIMRDVLWTFHRISMEIANNFSVVSTHRLQCSSRIFHLFSRGFKEVLKPLS